MPEQRIQRAPGITVTVDALALGGVYGLQCPAVSCDIVDTTPLDSGWATARPGRRSAGTLRVRMLLQPDDGGQMRLLAAYRDAECVTVTLRLAPELSLGWSGYVQTVRLAADHPDAPVSLEARLAVSGLVSITE